MLSRLIAWLRRLEDQAQGTDDFPGPGLAALLVYVEHHTTAEPWSPGTRRTFANSLTTLERQARARGLLMWPELDAAMEWLPTAARAYVDAVLHGQDPPERDATQAYADSTMQVHVSVAPLTA